MTHHTKRPLLRWTIGVSTLGLGVGLAFALFRHPVALVEWIARRTLGLAGLRQQLVEHHRGQWSYFRHPDPPASDVTVVLVHGLGGQAGNWFRTVRSLKNHDVVVLDLPGHGDCMLEDHLDWGSDVVYELFVDLLDEATDERPIVLVGNSMGGWLSMLYARDFPLRVRHLIPVNSAGLQFDLDQRMLLPRTREDAQRIVTAVYGRNAPKVPGPLLDAMIRDAHRTPIARAIDEVPDAPFLDGRLDEIRVSTDIVWGSWDSLIPLSHAYRLHQGIPDSKLHFIEGAGHSPQVSNPRRFNRLLHRLIGEHRIAPPRTMAHAHSP